MPIYDFELSRRQGGDIVFSFFSSFAVFHTYTTSIMQYNNVVASAAHSGTYICVCLYAYILASNDNNTHFGYPLRFSTFYFIFILFLLIYLFTFPCRYESEKVSKATDIYTNIIFNRFINISSSCWYRRDKDALEILIGKTL